MSREFLIPTTVVFRSAKERAFAERKATIGRFAAALMISVCLAAAGCERTPDDLESEYGQRSENRLASSVNGYGVLADMFAKAGHAVSTQSDLTPELKDSADVIVYAPDDFAPPNKKTINWFEKWLEGKEERTLIYIGRDFDAAPIYWRKIRPQVPPKEQLEVDRRMQQAEAEFRARRRMMPDKAHCTWFDIDAKAPHLDIKSLDGVWSLNIDPPKVEIAINSRITAVAGDRDTDRLLIGDGQTLVFRERFDPIRTRPQLYDVSAASQLIVVANGSFLVNLQLVNKEHRKLAGRLIGELDKPSRVVFLHADVPTRIRNTRGGGRQETAGVVDVFGVWPLSVILIQWIVVLALFCFSRWPIFGPPRDPQPPPASDFGLHIGALAETWELTRDSSYAQERWQHYQQHVRGEPGTVVANRKSRGGK
jgi:hypothetical protein